MSSSILYSDIPYFVLLSSKSLFPVEPCIFGCTLFMRDIRPQITKLDPKSLKRIFLGYSKGVLMFLPYS